MVAIYALIDPFTNHVRYVGKTERPLKQRLSAHIYDHKRGHKANWVQRLRSKKAIPIIEELERCTLSEWAEAEQFWISYFKFLGADLCNKSIGGERGALGYRKPEHLKVKNTRKIEHRVQISMPIPDLISLYKCAIKENMTVTQYILTAGIERANRSGQ